MKYFTNCRTLDDLKKEYRRLAMKHHPDHGGDTATMQAINGEYDAVFPAFKLAYNKTAETPTHETAESTRSEFYTQNGWKGCKHCAHKHPSLVLPWAAHRPHGHAGCSRLSVDPDIPPCR